MYYIIATITPKKKKKKSYTINLRQIIGMSAATWQLIKLHMLLCKQTNKRKTKNLIEEMEGRIENPSQIQELKTEK